MRLEMLKSQLLQAGLRRIPGPALPNVPCAGRANADVLKFCEKLRWPDGSFGFPITCMVEPSVEPVMSAPSEVLKPGVNGVPDMAAVIPESCQLPKTAPAKRLFSLLPGFGRS